MTTDKQTPIQVNAQMLIRKPIATVFNAFVDPTVTTNFWFTKSSGKLESGKTVRWDWEMYGVGGDVKVLEVVENQKILIAWDEPPNQVEWQFSQYDATSTLVVISNRGFTGTDRKIAEKAIDSKGGFTMVLAGLKAYLEHGIQLNLIGDHFPPPIN